MGLPQFGLMRDACFRAIGCDSVYEDGSFMLVAKGIADRPKVVDEKPNNSIDVATKNTMTRQSRATANSTGASGNSTGAVACCNT